MFLPPATAPPSLPYPIRGTREPAGCAGGIQFQVHCPIHPQDIATELFPVLAPWPLRPPARKSSCCAFRRVRIAADLLGKLGEHKPKPVDGVPASRFLRPDSVTFMALLQGGTRHGRIFLRRVATILRAALEGHGDSSWHPSARHGLPCRGHRHRQTTL